MPEKFWILESPKTRTATWDKGNLWKRSDHQACCSENPCVGFGGPATRMSELRVILRSLDIPDIAWTVTDCLIGKRALEMFRAEGFTGIGARRARMKWEIDVPGFGRMLMRSLVRPDNSEVSPEFWELIVTGWGGVAAKQSGFKQVPGTQLWEGCPDWSRIVDWDAWDGSDFFIVWPFGFTRLVTDRVAQFIQTNKLTGVRLISPEDYTKQYSRLRLNQSTSMRLRDFFPDKQAREIGEPLGIY